VTSLAFVQIMNYLEPVACVGALVLMHRKGQIRQYGFLSAYLLTRLLACVVGLGVISLAGSKLLEVHLAYRIYFYVYWFTYAIEALVGLGIIYSIYNLAMAPLKGLQRLGRLMFRWAAGIAVAVAVTTSFGPHVTSNGFIIAAVTQLQRTQSVLTLCLLLFVCLAIRPMGLSHRSKIFGISLGLGLMATTDLVNAAWLSQNKHLVSLYNDINGMVILSAVGIWCTYFAIPEPRRRMIILPTTSPFLRWNQISLALGDDPGFVAVGDVTPDMFAPAEVEVMRRASVKMGEALNAPRPQIERITG
jgi:hypothetical protein